MERHQPSGERGRPARCVPRLAEHIFGRAELFGGAPKRAGEAPALPGGLRCARPYFVVHFQPRKALNRSQAPGSIRMIARICSGGFFIATRRLEFYNGMREFGLLLSPPPEASMV